MKEMHCPSLKYCLCELRRLKDVVFVNIIEYGIPDVKLVNRVNVALKVDNKIFELVKRNDEAIALTQKCIVYPAYDDGHAADGKRSVKLATAGEVFSRLCPNGRASKTRLAVPLGIDEQGRIKAISDDINFVAPTCSHEDLPKVSRKAGALEDVTDLLLKLLPGRHIVCFCTRIIVAEERKQHELLRCLLYTSDAADDLL